MNIKKVLFAAGLLCWCASSCHISFCMELSDVPHLIENRFVYIVSNNIEGRVDNGQIPGFRILKEDEVVSPISKIWFDKGMIRKIVNIIYNDEYCPANDEFHPGNDTFFSMDRGEERLNFFKKKIEGVVENIDVNISKGIRDFLKGVKPVRWQFFIDAFLEKESSEMFTASKGFESLGRFLDELCGRGFEIDASGIRIGNNYLYYMVNKNLLMSKIMRNICHYLDIEAEDRDIEDCSFNDFLESLYGIQDGPDVVVQFNVMDLLMDRKVNPDFFFPDDIVEWYVKMFTERANMKK